MDSATDWLAGEDCILNGCLDFDGIDDRVDIPNSEFNNFVDNFSFGLWYKNKSSTSLENPVLLSMGKENDWNYAIFHNTINPSNPETYNKLICRLYQENLPDAYLETTVSNIFYENIDKWINIYCVAENNTLSMYINGRLVDTSNVPFGARDFETNGDLYLRYFDFTPWKGVDFNVDIDDFKIFNYPLSHKDILIEYNKGASLRFE